MRVGSGTLHWKRTGSAPQAFRGPIYGASHQARSAAAMTPAPANVCRSLRRDSEVRSSMLETSRWPGLFRLRSIHDATASEEGKAATRFAACSLSVQLAKKSPAEAGLFIPG